MITDAQHSLTLGSTIDFADEAGGIVVVDDDGNTFGSSELVTSVVASLLADGSIISLDREDNRTVQFRVMITGADSVELAQREATLVKELYHPNLLKWTPPDGLAPPSVFKVTADSSASVESLGSGVNERNLVRFYQVRLVCQPHAYSDRPTVVRSTPVATGDPVTISDGTSTDGWTGVTDGGDFLEPTSASESPHLINGTWHTYWSAGPATYAFDSPVDFTDTPYITVDVAYRLTVYGSDGSSKPAANGAPTLTLDGHEARAAGTMEADDPDYITWIFYVGPVTASSLSLMFNGQTVQDGDDWIYFINIIPDDRGAFTTVKRLPSSPVPSGTQFLMAPIGGTRRTPASVHVWSESGDLGYLDLMSLPASWGRWIPTLLDNVPVDGDGYWTENPQIPVSRIKPGISYLLGVGTDATVGDPIYWTATVDGYTATSATVAAGLVALPPMELPPKNVPGFSSLTMEIAVHGGKVIGNGALLLPLAEDCMYTSVDPAPAHVWLNAPTLSTPAPRIYAGSKADGSDAAAVQAGSWDAIDVNPGEQLFYIRTQATDAKLEVSYTKAWHTHAAE